MTTAVRPQPGPSREYHFPTFERRILENGLTLIVAPVQTLPLVTVSLMLDAGVIAEPAGKEGLASLTARTITEGTMGSDGEVLTERLEQLGTSVVAAADWDSTVVGLTTLSDKLPAAFALLAEIVSSPSFPVAAVERLKGERLAEIMQTESEPRELADEMFDAFIYADDSRYRKPIGGTRTTVAALTREDVVAFYAARYRPASATLIVVGDTTMDVAEQLVRDALHSWTGTAATPVRAIDAPARTIRAVQIGRKGDAPQSELRVGHVGVPRAHPDYYALTVANAVLGGLFSSRINLNLREAHGYTYGARSEFDWRREAGPFVISTAVASNVTADAIRETLFEIDRMRADEISESELSLATSYLNGVFPIRFETTSAIAAAIATLVVYGLDPEWYDTYRDRIAAVTSGDVLRVLHTHVDPAKLQVVVVGDAEVIRDPLAALDVGAVTVADANADAAT